MRTENGSTEMNGMTTTATAEKIENGMKFKQREAHGHDARFNDRTITVIDTRLDQCGRVQVESRNHGISSVGTVKRQWMSAKRLLSSAYRIIPLLLVAVLAACAGAPRKTARSTEHCTQAPQWTTARADGKVIGIFICFQSDGSLTYDGRDITEVVKANAASVTAPKAPAKKTAKP